MTKHNDQHGDNHRPPTLNALLASEDDEGIEAAIRRRDAGIRVTASGFVRGVIAGLIAEGEARRGPYRYIG